MIIGHLGISYVLSQLPVLTGHTMAPLDQAAIVASGYVLDWDLLLPGKRGGSNHHYSPTHTPAFALLMYMAFYAIFSSFFQPLTMFLIGVSMVFHLVCDDLDFWFYKLGFKKEIKDAQIIWLYPLMKRSQSIVAKRLQRRVPIIIAIGHYIRHPMIVRTEIAMIGIAVGVFLFQQLLHIDTVGTYLTLLFTTTRLNL